MSVDLALILAVAVAAALLLQRVGRTATYARRPVLTESELRFFSRLVDAVGDGDYVCPQLGMAAAIETRGGSAKSALAAFRRISQKRIDFCVCDARLVPKFVVELDDHTHDPARDRARDELLQQAGIRTFRFDVRRMPTTSELRTTLSVSGQGRRQ